MDGGISVRAEPKLDSRYRGMGPKREARLYAFQSILAHGRESRRGSLEMLQFERPLNRSPPLDRLATMTRFECRPKNSFTGFGY